MSAAVDAWRRRTERRKSEKALVDRLDRLARQQWQDEKKRAAADEIRREKARARRDIDLMPFGAGAQAVLRAVSGFCFFYRGYCAKTLEEIADKAGVSVRSARRHLRELEENGVIDRLHHGRGRGLTSIYRVCRSVIREAAERIRNAARRLPKKPAKRASGKPAKAVFAYIRLYLRPQKTYVADAFGSRDFGTAPAAPHPTNRQPFEPFGGPA